MESEGGEGGGERGVERGFITVHLMAKKQV